MTRMTMRRTRMIPRECSVRSLAVLLGFLLPLLLLVIQSVRMSLVVVPSSGSSSSATTATTTAVWLEHYLLLLGSTVANTTTTTTTTTTTPHENQNKVSLPAWYRNRPAIQDILQHPHKSTPSSRNRNRNHNNTNSTQLAWTHHRTLSLAIGQQAQAGNPNGHANKNTNSTATQNRRLRPMVDMTRNLRRIQDYYGVPDESKDDKQQHKEATRDTKNPHTRDPDTTNQNTQDDKPLNIVLFYADDWTMQVLGALNPHVQTPNIDAMAERGMLFTRNCVTTSICWISRNSLATGATAAVHGNTLIASRTMFQHDRFSWSDTLYSTLKQKGHYFTGLVGKWHAPAPPEHMQESFDVFQSYYGRHWMTRRGKDRHVTDLNGEDAMAFLNLWNTNHRHRPPKTNNNNHQQDERPFFLKISFFATHARDNAHPPYQPMNESLVLYVNATIPRPPTATEQHYQALPKFMKSPRNQAFVRNRNRFDTDEHYQTNIKDLYRMATEVDAVVGAVIAQLKELQAYDNTLLIFTTDNGNLHGEHGFAEKWYPYEESIRVPLVIQDPRMASSVRGTRNTDDLVLNVDLTPTILTAAQLPIPPHMQGRDISPLYTLQDAEERRHVQATWRQDFFYEWNTVRHANE